MRLVIAAATLALCPFVAPTQAAGCDQVAPWHRLGRSASELTGTLPLSLAAVAVAAPVAMAPSGADHALRRTAQTRLGGEPNLEPVTVWTPWLFPLGLVGVEVIAAPLGACEVLRPTSAMLQGFVLTLGMVTTLKWVAGRRWPNAGRDPELADRLSHPEYATRFHWFSWDEGNAWPSGHTATMMGAAAALGTVTYHQKLWGYSGYLVTLGVATGMYLGDHHWASDIVSGGLFGFAVGHSVGLAFRPSPEGPGSTGLFVLPWFDTAARGLVLVQAF